MTNILATTANTQLKVITCDGEDIPFTNRAISSHTSADGAWKAFISKVRKSRYFLSLSLSEMSTYVRWWIPEMLRHRFGRRSNTIDKQIHWTKRTQHNPEVVHTIALWGWRQLDDLTKESDMVRILVMGWLMSIWFNIVPHLRSCIKSPDCWAPAWAIAPANMFVMVLPGVTRPKTICDICDKDFDTLPEVRTIWFESSITNLSNTWYRVEICFTQCTNSKHRHKQSKAHS